MKIFIDSGNLKEIESLVPLGIIDGITTNPSLLAKEGGDYRALLKRICQIVKGPTSAEVVATDVDGMLREGRDLATIDEHIIVKVPFTKAGVQACKTLSSEGIRVNVTLVFTATQALLAAKVGATFVSPFVGRLDDIATSGPDQRDCRHLPELPVRHGDPGRFDTRADSHRRSRPPGRRYLHLSGGGDRGAVQAPVDRHRSRALPQGLGEGSDGEGLTDCHNCHSFNNCQN
jgi:hypothetical protein